MNRHARLAVFACALALPAPAAPPFDGTVFIDPDIITAADPGVFSGLTDAGQGTRTMFDRRTNAFGQYDAYLFQAAFADGPAVEVQVNPEFASVAAARNEALRFLPSIGRLPRALRADLATIWIHRGDEAFGGGNDNLLIHTGSLAEQYIGLGVLEEVFAHEAAHTSLDATHAASAGWLAAQASDNEFVSTYARDNPTREDVAETLVPWLAVACRPAVLEPAQVAAIRAAVPARLAYLDAQAFDLSPFPCDPARVFANGFEGP